MKTIMLLGCGYGIPNYHGEPGDLPDTHLEKLLKKQGHTVVNLSVCGGSNLHVFDRAKEYINGRQTSTVVGLDKHTNLPHCPTIDYVIWLNTSTVRDIDVDIDTACTMQLVHLTHKTYQTIHELRKALHWPKLIAVGSCGPVDEQLLSDYGAVEFCIPDWRADLLEWEEWSDHLSGAGHIFKNIDNIDNIDLDVGLAYTTQTAMADSELFPDGYYPGAVAHAGLFDNIKHLLE